MKFKVKEDCYCEHYLHELLYPRAWLKEKKLQKGDKVKFVREFSNLFGTYFTVKKKGSDTTYDIPPHKLEEIKKKKKKH